MGERFNIPRFFEEDLIEIEGSRQGGKGDICGRSIGEVQVGEMDGYLLFLTGSEAETIELPATLQDENGTVYSVEYCYYVNIPKVRVFLALPTYSEDELRV